MNEDAEADTASEAFPERHDWKNSKPRVVLRLLPLKAPQLRRSLTFGSVALSDYKCTLCARTSRLPAADDDLWPAGLPAIKHVANFSESLTLASGVMWRRASVMSSGGWWEAATRECVFYLRAKEESGNMTVNKGHRSVRMTCGKMKQLFPWFTAKLIVYKKDRLSVKRKMSHHWFKKHRVDVSSFSVLRSSCVGHVLTRQWNHEFLCKLCPHSVCDSRMLFVRLLQWLLLD